MLRPLALLTALALAVSLLFAAAASADDSVYWASVGNNLFSHAAFAGGSGANFNPGANQPDGSAFDSATGRVYWADFGSKRILSSNLDGSDVQELNTAGTTVVGPDGVAIDPASRKIYWANANGNTISWASLDGSGGHTLNTNGAEVFQPRGVVVSPADGRLYWANFLGNSIGFANLDGTGDAGVLTIPAAMINHPSGVVIDAELNRIYWTNVGNGANGSIAFTSLAGSGGRVIDVELGGGLTVGAPVGAAIEPDLSAVFFADENQGHIISVGTDGGPAVALDTGAANLLAPSYPFILEKPQSSLQAEPDFLKVEQTGTNLECAARNWEADAPESFFYRAPQIISYHWEIGGTSTPSADGKNVQANEAGTYACTVTATNGAGSTSVFGGSFAVTGNTVNGGNVGGNGGTKSGTGGSGSKSSSGGASVAIVKVKTDARHGTAALSVQVSGAGKLALSGKGVATRSATASKAGVVTLKVAAGGSTARTLRKSGRAKVKVTVKFTASAGGTATATRSVSLRRR